MKKFLALLFCLTLLCMPLTACGGGKTDADPEEEVEEVSETEEIADIDEDKLEAAGDTLEARLKLLKKDGWKKKDGAYVYTSDEEDCKGEFVITAKGNEADVTVTFDYFDDNKEMIDFYKEDTEAGKAVCAYWYLRAASVLDVLEGTENYKLIVGDTEVLSGSMTYTEAEDICDGYFVE